MAAATIVHDPSEAVPLCPALGLYLKPITRMSISVALPPLTPPGKSISNWEVMERLRALAPAHAQFSVLRIAKSTLDFVRFEGELEQRALVRPVLACLDGRTLKLSGFPDALRVRATELRADFPTPHAWDAFFRDAPDMDEARPGERPDTVHLEGLPCRWFAPREAISGATSGAGGGASERPSEELLRQAFGTFGDIRHVDIPMLDPYREEMAGRSFHTFSFGGHLNFEAYVQYREYAGFVRAMSALRGMKLMYKGEDGKAVACNIKVSFDSTKHLSDASIRKRELEREKLRELEQQREEQKRREKEAEERQRAEERKQREAEEQDRERRREEKLRRREQRRSRKRAEKLQAEEQRRLHFRVRTEERKLLLAQRNLQSLRLVAELLGRAEVAEQRRRQEAELRRVEREKERALGLQRRERELRQRLVTLLLGRHPGTTLSDPGPAHTGSGSPAHSDPLRPVLDLLRGAGGEKSPTPSCKEPEAAPEASPPGRERAREAAPTGGGRQRAGPEAQPPLPSPWEPSPLTFTLPTGCSFPGVLDTVMGDGHTHGKQVNNNAHIKHPIGPTDD
ncbi:A-kinase anchor protein 17A-like isoform X2 [Meriones unguiculatus]|uniref:A-kinase anchor protein 17A-like isoform X2 n=1 Tax=Meriones unguiculatus TaxID=10047 RepID=UPI000B4F1C53|nr:A-kinase anchor protein 17A-like isoform X2 [Meriones unguiculatus]